MKTAKIVQKKLGRERALGQYKDWIKTIEIDPRQSPKEELDTILHEAIHHALPFLDEPATAKAAKTLTMILYKYGYRKKSHELTKPKTKTR